MSSPTPMTIGALAKAADTKVVTIRYYEKIGLLPPPARTAANYRLYGQGHLDRLLFIRKCRDLGFTLNDIRDLLRLVGEQDQDCVKVDRIAAAHLAAVERKIDDLQRLAAELRRLSAQCRGGTIGECRIIEALSAGAGDA